MRILVTNDDGIGSMGLELLAQEASVLGEVSVIAPTTERSGIGKAVTLGSIAMRKAKLRNGKPALTISGFPADCIALGIDYVLEQPPDLVLAGINLGPNLSIQDYLDSGTIGAVMEASLRKVPAVAISLCITRGRKLAGRFDLRGARSVARRVMSMIGSGIVPRRGSFLSLNVPHPTFQGYASSRINPVPLVGIYERIRGGFRVKDWGLEIYGPAEPGTDVHTVRETKAVSVVCANLLLQSDTRESLRFLEALKSVGCDRSRANSRTPHQ